MKNYFKLNPPQILFISFVTAIVIGTILLYILPVSSEKIKLIDALFTATSSVCVTGLIVKNTPVFFNFLGQIIILILIQLGGLGIMTFYALVLNFLKGMKKKDQYIMKEILEEDSLSNISKTLTFILKFTFLTELIGVIILTINWWNMDTSKIKVIWFSLFHSISAFCNAGFSLFPNSLENFIKSPFTLMIFSILIVLGGIGFPVIDDISKKYRLRQKRKLSLHSKIAINTTLILILLGTVFYFFSETPFLDTKNRIFVSLFHSITPRTAGFNVLSVGSFSITTIIFTIILMFIGASPGGTGGGIKTVTFAVIYLKIKGILNKEDEPVIYKKQINKIYTERALLIFFLALSLIIIALLILSITETFSLKDLFFEVVSAFGTVGLSTGITPYFSKTGKLILTLLMLAGRLGPLTIILALSREKEKVKINYAEEKIIVG